MAKDHLVGGDFDKILGAIYSAEDITRKNEKVALKIEKPDKSKRILMFEYDVLK